MDLDRIVVFARRHHGLVSRTVAEELGLSRRGWYWAIESGRLEQTDRGVARLPGAPDTPAQRILAALWSCGDGAIASHRSGAHLWCPVDPPPRVVDVILAREARRRTRPDVVVHRPTDIRDLRPVWRAGIPTTNPLRTLVDLGEVDERAVRPFFERAVIAGFVSPTAAWTAVLRHSAKGRQGTRVLRAVLDDWSMNDTPPDSVLEEAFNSLLARHSLPPARFHADVCGYEVDFLIGRVVVECDGWATHGLDRETFESDRVRDAVLSAAGYVVVRFTWRQIRRQGALVARRLHAVLRRAEPDLVLGKLRSS